MSGLELFRKRKPSAILLDLCLPDISGQEVCQQITRTAPGLPVIVLSAKADVVDKVVLLETGARDYVTKPFSPNELLDVEGVDAPPLRFPPIPLVQVDV